MGNCVSSSASAPLFDAIAGGDAPAAVGAISANPALSHKRMGSQRRTAFHACATDGQQEVLKQICALVWRSVPDSDGVVHGDAGAPATGRQHPTILLAINAYDQAGLTPLILACQKGHVQVTELLLLQGADPWIGDRLMARSPLHHAASANQPGCIQAILSSPLVAQVGKAAGRLAECKLADLPSNCGYAPLHYAAASRSAEAAAALLSFGASPNAKTWALGFDWLQLKTGSTPLHAAAKFGCLEVAMMLVKYYDDHLRRLGVIDPRVVENAERVKPYQLPRARPDKVLARVLDPATPIREISDPFGEEEGGAGRGVCAAARIKVAPGKVAPLKGSSSARGSSGLADQDSDLSRLSYGSANASDRAATAPSEEAAAAVGAGPGARPPNRGAKLEAIRPVGEFHVPSLPNWYVGGGPHTAEPAAETAAAAAGQAVTGSGLQVPPGWEDLLPADQGGEHAPDGGREKHSHFISVYRAPEMDATSRDSGTPFGLTRGASRHRVTPGGPVACGPPHLPAASSLPRPRSPPPQPPPLHGSPSSGRVPSDTAPAPLSSQGSLGAATASSPRAGAPPATAAAAGARSSTGSSWGYDGQGPASCSRVPSPNTELIPPPPAAVDPAARYAGYAVGPSPGPGLTRGGSGAAPPPAKPGSPEEGRSAPGAGSGKSLAKTLSKKLSSFGAAAGAATGASPAALRRTPTGVARGGSGTLGADAAGLPAVLSAWGAAVSTPTKSSPAAAAHASTGAGAPLRSPSTKAGPAAADDCFTRDSHAEDAEPVAITMYPHVLASVQRLKEGETFNRISASDSSKPLKQHGGGGAGGKGGASGGGADGVAAAKAFSVSRRGLMATNDLSEDESRPERQAPGRRF